MFARYYNSATGRFLRPDWDAKSSDPVPYAKLDNPQSLNLYSFVYNDPLGHADPDGHAGCTIVRAHLLQSLASRSWSLRLVVLLDQPSASSSPTSRAKPFKSSWA